jgi:transposase
MNRARRRYLIRLGRRSGEPQTALRFLAVARLGLGLSSVQVANDLDVARSTVVKAAGTFASDGIEGLYDRRRFNGASKVDDRFRRRLAELLVGTPQDFGWPRPTWTRELLCREMLRQGFRAVAVCTMGRALHDIGARLGMVRPIVLCPWPRERKERVLRALRSLAASSTDREPVLYADEVDIHLNPRIGRDWMLRGHQRRIVTPGQNVKHYVAGALAAHNDVMTWVDGAKKNSTLFVQLLFRVASQYRKARRIHLIVDNYVIHDSRLTRRVIADMDGRVVLHFLPPYCPDHNRIERRWQDLHANVTRNHRCTSMPKLMSNVHSYLHLRNFKCAPSVRQLRSVI